MLAGVEALVLDGSGDRVRLPRPSPTERGYRRVNNTQRMEAGGEYEARAEEILTGLYAMSWRHVLVDLSDAERRHGLSRLVGAVLPGARVDSLDIVGIEAEAETMTIRWRARGSAHLEAGGARLSVGLSPERLSRATVHQAERDTTMLISRSTDLEVDLRVDLAGLWTVSAPPGDVDVAQGLVRYSRRIESSPSSLRVRKSCGLTVGLIAPSDYPAWVAAARSIDRADLIELRFERAPQ